MRNLMFLVALVISLQGFCQKDNRVVIGTKDSLFSKVLNEVRNYEVYLPPSYNAANKTVRFPVLYLLDGNSHFHSVSGLIEQLAGGVNGNTLFPEMIVIAINNTDRTRDLTPIHYDIGPDG